MKRCLSNFFFFTFIVTCFSLNGSIFTNFVEHNPDPVYEPFNASDLYDDYHPSVLFSNTLFDGNGDAVLYKMWHQGPPNDGNPSIAYSTSNDGVNWTLQNEVAVRGDNIAAHPVVIYDANGFGGGPNHYKMWFWTGTISDDPPTLPIHSAESIDGITWTSPSPNTQDATQFLVSTSVGLGNTPFYQFYGFASVLYNPNATSVPGQPYTFPYVAFFDSSAAQTNNQEAVGLAYSIDGINWFRFGSQGVLTPSGNTADWDGVYVYSGAVIKLAVDNKYHMYYSGSNGINNPNSAFAYTFGIGHASSSDGINWVKDPDNPIFTINDAGETWRSGRTLFASIIFRSTTSCENLLQMWFSGGTNIESSFDTAAIGFAENCLVFPFDPPSDFLGKIIRRCRGSCFQLELKTKWTASPTADVVAYRIYKGGAVVATVPATDPLRASFCIKNRREARLFSITAVDSQGNETAHVPLVVVATCGLVNTTFPR